MITCDLFNNAGTKLETIHVAYVPMLGHTITVQNEGSASTQAARHYRVTAIDHQIGYDLSGYSHHSLRLVVRLLTGG